MSHYKAGSGEASENSKRDCLYHDPQKNICGCQRVEKVAGKHQVCVQLSSNVDNFSEFIRNVQTCEFIKSVGYKTIYISKMGSCKSSWKIQLILHRHPLIMILRQRAFCGN